MKILKAKINWFNDFCNSPTLQILVDTIPDCELLRYKKKGPLYYAELDGYVNFYYYTNPDEGFGGRKFHIILEDSSEVVLKGPWSSSASFMNGAGFTPCMEINITAELESFERGFTFCAAAITVEKAKEALRFIQGGSLIKIANNNRTEYMITKIGEAENIEVIASRDKLTPRRTN